MLDALRQVVDRAEDVADVGHGRDGVRASWPCAAPQRVVVQRPAQVRLPALQANGDALGWVAARFVASMACGGGARDAAGLPALWLSELAAGFAREPS